MTKKLESVIVQVKGILNDDPNKVVEVNASDKSEVEYLKKNLKSYDVMGMTSISTNVPGDESYVLHVRNYGGRKNA